MMVHTFTVAGRGEFPLDMLRHDQCWPVSGDDAASISHTYTGLDRTIKFRTVMITPTVGRWMSFGWVVTEIDGRTP